MRLLLVDHHRTKVAEKRGGGELAITLPEQVRSTRRKWQRQGFDVLAFSI